MDFRILYDLSDLKDTGFGQPHPRHGLNLLWWFAHDYVRIDSNGHIIAKYDPAKRAFGFKRFCNDENLLPDTKILKYYEVGNLRTPGSAPNCLPKYVTKNYTGYLDGSNKDRIIVSFASSFNKFGKIYVTQHLDQTNFFDQNHTYWISNALMKKIRELRREHFLRETINHSHVSKDKHQSVQTNSCQSTSNEPIQDNQELNREDFLIELSDYSTDMSHSMQHNQTNTCLSNKCCCVLICCSLLVLIIIAVAVYLLSK